MDAALVIALCLGVPLLIIIGPVLKTIVEIRRLRKRRREWEQTQAQKRGGAAK